jgi:hypothetical protein
MASQKDYLHVVRKLGDWLADGYDEQGIYRSDPDNVYYKIAATFGYCGRRRLAINKLEQFQHRFIKNGRLTLESDSIRSGWSVGDATRC